jgi:hypothetical protein
MAQEINTEIFIKAPAEKVWRVLTTFENYTHWNPFIKSLEGKVAVGNHIKVKIEPPNSKGMTFKPQILVYKPNQELRWLGSLLFKGLFDGEHRFELIDHQNGTTTFKQSEIFKGLLVGLLNIEQTKKGFEDMNEKLKELAENND